MLKDYSEFLISSVVAIEHTAALFYSWSICYIVNRSQVTLLCSRSIFVYLKVLKPIPKICQLQKTRLQRLQGLTNPITLYVTGALLTISRILQL